MKHALYRFIATGVYTGYCPIAPGTAGSLLAAGAVLVLPGFHGFALAAAAAVFFFAGVVVSGEIEKTEGHDAPIIVIDEIVGTWTAMCLIPNDAPLIWFGAALVLFRSLDIFKPFPIDRMQRLPGGLGVMADDLAAGLIAGLFLVMIRTVLAGGMQ